MIEAKVPPHSTITEQRIISAILQNAQNFDYVIESLQPESFYIPKHVEWIKACFALFREKQPINYITIAGKVATNSKEETETAFELMKLQEGYVRHEELESYIEIVKDKQVKRDLIHTCHKAMMDSYNDTDNCEDIISNVESSIYNIANQIKKNDYQHVSEGAVIVIEKAEQAKVNQMPFTGVDTGYLNLNYQTSGWQQTDLIILAARPSVGKTAFALNLAYNAVISQYKQTAVGYFSLEMTTWQLSKRLMAMSGQYTMTELSTGKNTATFQLHEDAERLSIMPIFVDDTASLNIWSLRNKAKKMVNRENVGLIIVDYLQLITGERKGNSNREQEISEISRSLKNLAKELNVPIIALSQLSRDVEKRTNKRPMLSDLRESGAIEQDADMVMFLHGHSKEEIMQNADLANKKYLTIAKFRNGELENFEFESNGQKQRWQEIGIENQMQQLPTNTFKGKMLNNEGW